TERLLEAPASLVSPRIAASLQASELLVPRGPSAGAEAVASTPGSDSAPVVLSTPRGAGRLIVSVAMDARRFRAQDHGSLDSFWQALIAGLALAAPPPLDVEVVPAILRPGAQADVIVRARTPNVSGVSATIDGNQPMRLWPEAERGVFRGRFDAPLK